MLSIRSFARYIWSTSPVFSSKCLYLCLRTELCICWTSIITMIIPVLLTLVIGVFAGFQPLGAPFKAPVSVLSGFYARVLYSNLTLPRGIAFDSLSNLLVVEHGFGITAFSKIGPPIGGWERTVVIQNPNFTQGIQVDGTKLYASTASEALLFDYNPSTKSVSGSATVIVNGLPPDGGLCCSRT